MEHFCATLGEQFRHETTGIALYRGNADFKFVWDEEQKENFQHWLKNSDSNFEPEDPRLLALFCRDACAEFLELLAKYLPDPFERFLLLDTSHIQSPLTVAQLTTQERFPLFKLVVKGNMLGEIGWESRSSVHTGYFGTSFKSQDNREIKIGVCLPPVSDMSWIPELESCLTLLMHKQISFKMIPEEQLTARWDCLDYLIVATKFLSQEGRRKIFGFCAAGGEIVALGQSLNSAQEISLDYILKVIG